MGIMLRINVRHIITQEYRMTHRRVASTMESRLQEQLDRRCREGNLRSLMQVDNERKPLIDFASNDYLGLARCHNQHSMVQTAYNEHLILQSKSFASPVLGATGSRLLSGDSNLARSLEKHLACVHNRPASLLFNSGYDANLSVLSSLPYKESDAIIMDELVHNSLIMGVRMGRINRDRVFLFRHNDVNDLKSVIEKIQLSALSEQFSILVVVESVYSMDGDIAPLSEMLQICEKTGATLMVDEAHGLGIYGRSNVQDLYLDFGDSEQEFGADNGSSNISLDGSNNITRTTQQTVLGGTGVLAALNLEHHPSLFCSIHTFGKAAGCHGAVVAGSNTLVSYLVNYARPFVYSTALPPHSLITIEQSYKSMTGHEGEKRRGTVFKWVKLFRQEVLHGLTALAISDLGINLLPSPSPIQALIVPGSQNCIDICSHLREVGGLDVYPIRSPTVPKGEERIRIILHAHNSEEGIRRLIQMLLMSLEQRYKRSKL
jgi:8-amino-7-oxononanoate synthase